MRNAFDNFVGHFVKKPISVPAGIYHAHSDIKAEHPYRMHLRVEMDGTGILILNASTVLHLNPTAVEYAYCMTQGLSVAEAVKKVSAVYDVDESRASADYSDFTKRIESLLHTSYLDPVTYLDFERVEPYSRTLMAPYRLDCALTYRVRDGIEKNVAPTERVKRELNSDEWRSILRKAWQAGIPHVIFTGGEPTLRPDLPDLISYGEELGLVTGLSTDGIAFLDTSYLESLLTKGLDHITLLADSTDWRFWQALQNAIAADVHVTVHLTLSRSDELTTPEVLSRLSIAGIGALSLSISDISEQKMLQDARQKAAELGLRLVWDLPVPYSRQHPIAIETGEFGKELPDGAGNAWMYVEPDGDALPAQGINRVLGNWLTNEWATIAAAR